MSDEPAEQNAPVVESAPIAEPAPAEIPAITVEAPVPEPTTSSETTDPIPTDAPAPEVSEPEPPEPAPSQVEPAIPEIKSEPERAAPTPGIAPSSLSTALLSPSDLATRGLAERQAHREEKLQKILGLVQKEGSIGSTDVQKYLHVSDSTATRYLKELIKQGKLKRVGSPNRARYEIA